ncbi:MAG: DinB family protein [Pseudomonadota bacterium]
MSDTHLNSLVDSNISTLNAASGLLEALPVDQFTRVQQPYFESSLGKHLRHVLDHYLCFQRDYDSGLIDYDQRNRDCQLETDKDYALGVISQLRLFFLELKARAKVDQPLKVLMCNDVATPNGEITQSSLGRELQFMQGHSVHHYALMAAMMRFSGHPVNDHFGVAPSTIVHKKTVKETA